MKDPKEIYNGIKINRYNSELIKKKKTIISENFAESNDIQSQKLEKVSFIDSSFLDIPSGQIKRYKSLQNLGNLKMKEKFILNVDSNGIKTVKASTNNNILNFQKKIDSKKEEKPELLDNNKFIKNNNISGQNIYMPNNIYYPVSNNYIGIPKEIEISEIIHKINNNLKHKPYQLDELIDNLKIFYMICPTINEFKNVKILLREKDFDIFDKKEETKFLFELNMSNLISIINLIYSITADIKNFIYYLNKINVNFSFVKRNIKNDNNEIDFVLMASMTSRII